MCRTFKMKTGSPQAAPANDNTAQVLGWPALPTVALDWPSLLCLGVLVGWLRLSWVG